MTSVEITGIEEKHPMKNPLNRRGQEDTNANGSTHKIHAVIGKSQSIETLRQKSGESNEETCSSCLPKCCWNEAGEEGKDGNSWQHVPLLNNKYTEFRAGGYMLYYLTPLIVLWVIGLLLSGAMCVNCTEKTVELSDGSTSCKDPTAVQVMGGVSNLQG